MPRSVALASTFPTSERTISPTLLPVPSMLAVKHTGAVHEFYCYIFGLVILTIMRCYGCFNWGLGLGSAIV